MIDEAVLEELLAQVGDEIPVPVGGPETVLSAFAVSATRRRRARVRLTKPALGTAAAVAAVALLAVPVMVLGGSGSSDKSAMSTATSIPRVGVGPDTSLPRTGNSSGGPVDAARIVKTGTLDLQVAHATLRVAVNRVTGVTGGLGGYVANSKTTYDTADPYALITVRVPADAFETAVTRFRTLPGVKVLGDSESGTDVTAQYSDLLAQLAAATSARDALLVVLSEAETVGDILAVQDRVTVAQTRVEELQGRINRLGDQAAYSSLSITLSERPTAEAARSRAADEGIGKAWSDARHGFSSGIEWIVARSGGALIVLLAALALLFGIRYLYPIVRRGLL